MEIKSLFDAASWVEGANIKLEDALYALQVLEEAMEDEGKAPADWRDGWKAASFMGRFPAYMATYRVLYREIERISGELKEISDGIYRSCRGNGDKL